jgi:hypothetical protein
VTTIAVYWLRNPIAIDGSPQRGPLARCYDGTAMNLLAIIIVFLAVVTASAIAYIAWELSSGRPVFSSKRPTRGAGNENKSPEA